MEEEGSIGGGVATFLALEHLSSNLKTPNIAPKQVLLCADLAKNWAWWIAINVFSLHTQGCGYKY